MSVEMTYWQEAGLAQSHWLTDACKHVNESLNPCGLNLAIEIDYDDDCSEYEPFITVWLYNLKNGSWAIMHYDDMSTDSEAYHMIYSLESLWAVL